MLLSSLIAAMYASRRESESGCVSRDMVSPRPTGVYPTIWAIHTHKSYLVCCLGVRSAMVNLSVGDAGDFVLGAAMKATAAALESHGVVVMD